MIRIRRGGAKGLAMPDPIVSSQTTITDADGLTAWEDVPPPNAKPRPCKHCGLPFINPCGAEHPLCDNYLRRKS